MIEERKRKSCRSDRLTRLLKCVVSFLNLRKNTKPGNDERTRAITPLSSGALAVQGALSRSGTLTCPIGEPVTVLSGARRFARSMT